MWDSGIRNVVGDNSVAALLPTNPYHGMYTTVEKHGFPGIFIIPRQATSIPTPLPLHLPPPPPYQCFLTFVLFLLKYFSLIFDFILFYFLITIRCLLQHPNTRFRSGSVQPDVCHRIWPCFDLGRSIQQIKKQKTKTRTRNELYFKYLNMVDNDHRVRCGH